MYLVETDIISSKMPLAEDTDANHLSAGFILKVCFSLMCCALGLALFPSVFWLARPKEERKMRAMNLSFI